MQSMSTSPVLPPGTMLGRYRIERYLKGNMGQIYLAEDPVLQRKVVVKVLYAKAHKREVLERWWREMRTLACLAHPHVVSIYDAHVPGEDDSLSYIVMEYAPLGSLQDVLELLQSRATTMAVAKAIELGLQISEALCAVHAAGVVHRDVKPSNILVTKSPTGRIIYKLADFGIATASDLPRVTLTHEQSPFSPPYAAPEQHRGGRVDERADIYALGATLWECLAQPYGSLARVRQARGLEQPLPLLREYRQDIPASLAQLIERATEPDPNKRFQSATEMLAALHAAQASLLEQISERTQPLPAPPSLKAKHRDWQVSLTKQPALGIAVIAGVAVALVVFALLLRSRSDMPTLTIRSGVRTPISASSSLTNAQPLPTPQESQLDIGMPFPVGSSESNVLNAGAATSAPFVTPVLPRVRVRPEATATAAAQATASAKAVLLEYSLKSIVGATTEQAWILGREGFFGNNRLLHYNGTELVNTGISLDYSMEQNFVSAYFDGTDNTLWVLSEGNLWKLVGNEWQRVLDVDALFAQRRYAFKGFFVFPDDTMLIYGLWGDSGSWWLQKSFWLTKRTSGQWEIEFFDDSTHAAVLAARSVDEVWFGDKELIYSNEGQLRSLGCRGEEILRFRPLPNKIDEGYLLRDWSSRLMRLSPDGQCNEVVLNPELTKGFSPWTFYVLDNKIWVISREGEWLGFEDQVWRRRRLLDNSEVRLNSAWAVSDRTLWLAGDRGLLLRYHEGRWQVMHGNYTLAAN